MKLQLYEVDHFGGEVLLTNESTEIIEDSAHCYVLIRLTLHYFLQLHIWLCYSTLFIFFYLPDPIWQKDISLMSLCVSI